MNDQPAIDIEPAAGHQAVAIRQPAQSGALGPALEPDQIQTRAPMTAAQGKVDAVAALTMAAYEKAATLALTREETEALRADFPDEAFKPGAAGKEHLIYIEHAYLRERFTEVFGMGQWALIPRNRWAEPFKTQKGQDGSRVYVEAMLVVRGCFVGEAIGEMEYYPHNASQNYGDAVEGAKTAAFRRCAKEFGVGLQAWKKDFGDSWWQRKRQTTSQPPARPPTTTHAASAPATHPPAAPQAATIPTEESRAKMIAALKAGPSDPNREIVTEFFVKAEILMPGEQVEDVPLRWCPGSVGQMRALSSAIAAFANGEQAGRPYPMNGEPEPVKEPRKAKPTPPGGVGWPQPVEVPQEAADSRPRVTGVIDHVTQKGGTSKKGPWKLYGIKIGEHWFNTFSDTLGALAQERQGQSVTLIYNEGEKGNTAEEIL